jgi:hypothetical protein
MKKLILLISALTLFSSAVVFAQDELSVKAKSKTDEKKLTENPEGWKLGGTGSLTFNQVGLKNWAAGGDPSFSLLGVLNAYADYKYGRHLWQSRLGVEYGTQKNKGQSIRKNSDRLEIFSKYGYEITNKVYVSAYANIRTLITPTYEYDSDGAKTRTISRFASPMFVEAALGMDYVPNKHLSVFASPLATKMTIVANDEIAALDRHGAFGKNFRYEIGASAIIAYKQEVMKNVNIQSVARIFKDYRRGPAQNIDIDWQNTIGLKVNKFLSAAVFTHLIWDYDQLIPQFDDQGTQTGTARKVQFRNVIGVGLAYTLDKKIEKTTSQQ